MRVVIGKGGMGAKTLAGLKASGAVYLNAIGGAAQFYARCIERVEGVSLMEFGTPEAMWHLQVRDFPAIVTMDAHGASLHREVEEASGRYWRVWRSRQSAVESRSLSRQSKSRVCSRLYYRLRLSTETAACRLRLTTLDCDCRLRLPTDDYRLSTDSASPKRRFDVGDSGALPDVQSHHSSFVGGERFHVAERLGALQH